MSSIAVANAFQGFAKVSQMEANAEDPFPVADKNSSFAAKSRSIMSIKVAATSPYRQSAQPESVMQTRKLDLENLQHLFAIQLLIICTVETLVHFFMPFVIPDSRNVYQGIAEALLLSAVTAPFVWATVARPLRVAAVLEPTRAETILKSINEAVICFDLQGQIESLNPAAERMFGWQSHEMVGQSLTKMIPNCHNGGSILESDGFLGGAEATQETFCRHRDGTSSPVVLTITRLNASGPALFVATIREIPEPKRAAVPLDEQRVFSLRVVQHLAVPCFVLGQDHRVLMWNGACEELTGVTSTEVIGTDFQWKGFYQERRPTLADIVLDGVPPTLYVRWERSTHDETGLQCEGWHRCVGGKDRYLMFDAVPVRNDKGEMIAVVETLHDLTDMKNAEEAMAKSEEKFFKAFQASPDGMFINTTLEGLFVEANDAFVQMLGYRRDEIIGHSSVELGLWVDPKQRALIVEQAHRKGKVRNLEVSIRVKSGLVRTFLWSSDVIRLKDRDCLIGNVRDVTDQKENDHQLRERTAELRSKHQELSLLFGQVQSAKKEWEKTMDCINDMIILLDHEGRVKRCNRAAMEFVGASYGEILGRNWQQLSAQGDLPLCPINAVQNVCCYESHCEASDTWLAVTFYPDKDGEVGTSGTVVTIRNITEEKRAAIELFQAYTETKEAHNLMMQQEKMASLGELAAGVAHEINNPTGYIISNLGTLDKYQARLIAFIKAQNEIMSGLEPSELQKLAAIRKQMKIDHIIGDIPALVSESMDGAKRIKNIVHSLKGFSRKDDDICTTASMTECLESTINIVWNQIKYTATLRKEFGEVPAIRCYPQKLSQVFMNLIVNAAHALGEKGEITVSTWHESDAVYISVADTGSGIPEDIRDKIFEPFFTTKDVGKGTGLGLSISREIVREHGGEITVESVIGTGATFTVMLPLNGVKKESD